MHFDRILVYGDQRIFDTMEEYDFPGDLRDRSTFVGYINRFDLAAVRHAMPSDEVLADIPAGAPVVTCMLGGGQGAERVAAAFAESCLPRDTYGVLVTGPYSDAGRIASLLRRDRERERFRLLRFSRSAEALLRRADRAILSAGYNTACEMMSTGVFSLVVPRIRPRREQLMRAEMLSRLGYADFVPPSLATPRAFERFFAMSPTRSTTPAPVDLHGLTAIACSIAEMMREQTRRAS
jgi:predicted glycosyltransferase